LVSVPESKLDLNRSIYLATLDGPTFGAFGFEVDPVTQQFKTDQPQLPTIGPEPAAGKIYLQTTPPAGWA
jgi:hypothetical protein